MSILSITFHVVPAVQTQWESFIDSGLISWLENLQPENRFYFSEVDSHYVQEGRNYNLLLIFKDAHQRQLFSEQDIFGLVEKVEEKFSPQEVMIFNTLLNKIHHNL